MLYPYQLAGARWLAGRSATTNHVGLLADGMGLGKSAQSVGACDTLGADRVTVICPAIMCGEWRETFYRFGDVPRPVHVVDGRGLPTQRSGALVTSYERAQQPDVAEYIRRRGGVIIFDECHYLKDPGSNRTLRLFSGSLAGPGQRIICLSGTPAPNHAGELYPLMARAGLARGEYGDWLARYCVTRPTEHGFQVLGHRNVDELRSLLGAVMLRRTHKIVLQPTDYKDVTIPLGECDTRGDVFRAFARIAPSAAQRVARLVGAGNLNGLDNAETATVRRLVGCLKAVPSAHRIAAVLDRDPAHKAVVFCLHSDPIALLVAELKDYGVIELTGATQKRRVPELVARFQTDPGTRVAVCQMRAAGVGVTLTAANYLFMLERPWSPADEDQAEHRIIRIGQTRPTFVRRIALEGSIDQPINGVLIRKRRIIAEIIE